MPYRKDCPQRRTVEMHNSDSVIGSFDQPSISASGISLTLTVISMPLREVVMVRRSSSPSLPTVQPMAFSTHTSKSS